MNRDESRSRQSEIEPGYYWGNDILGPKDSTGGGTWIGVNKAGFYAALLNAYGESDYLPSTPRSRGEIIPQILSAIFPEQTLLNMHLEFYPGFKLVIGHKSKAPTLFSWNGRQLIQQPFHSQWQDKFFFQTSSSVDQDKNISIRSDVFEQWARKSQQLVEGIPSIHYSQEPNPSSAILMARDKSVTKSITSITLDNNDIKMCYFDVSCNSVALTRSYSFHGKK